MARTPKRAPKSRRARPLRRPRPTAGPGHSLVPLACSQFDPFCPHARGAKVLDENATNTFTFTSYELMTATSNATGYSYLEFGPSVRQARNAATIDAAGVVTGTGTTNSVPNYTELLAQADAYRIVSYGVHIMGISNAMTSSGFVRVESANSFIPIGGTYGTFSTDAQMYPLKPGLEVHWVSKPSGGADSIEFKRVDSQLLGNDYPRTGVRIWTVGAPPDTPIMTVEIVMHIECTPKIGTLLATTATPGAQSMPHVMTAARNAAATAISSQSGSTTSFSAYLKRHAAQAIMGLGRMGATALGNVAGPIMGQLAGAAFGAMTAPGPRQLRNYSHGDIMEVD